MSWQEVLRDASLEFAYSDDEFDGFLHAMNEAAHALA